MCDALKHVNLVLNPGEKLAVVGENGAGKTTFIKLLMRLYDPDEGEILLDGVNVRDIAYEEYMALFSNRVSGLPAVRVFAEGERLLWRGGERCGN